MGIAVGRDLTGGVCDYLTRAKRAVARTTFTPREQGTTQHGARRSQRTRPTPGCVLSRYCPALKSVACVRATGTLPTRFWSV